MAVGILSLLAAAKTFLLSGGIAALTFISPIGGLIIFIWGSYDIWVKQDYELPNKLFYTVLLLLPFVGLVLYLGVSGRYKDVEIGEIRGRIP